jgi:hypothetical protein
MGRLHGTEYWRRRAKLQLKLEPLCQMCMAVGRDSSGHVRRSHRATSRRSE